MSIYKAYEKCRKKARLKWRKSRKGQWWDYQYYQRPEVKARRHQKYIERKIKGYVWIIIITNLTIRN